MHYTTIQKISSSAIVILFLLVLLASVKFSPVSAQSITRAPTNGAVGTSVTITGTAFLPNSLARVFYDGLQVGNATTSGTGGFKVIFAIPSSTAGVHNILATDGVNSIPTTFTVTSSMTRAPTSGIVGTTITLTGYGYAASSTITVKWDGLTLVTTPATVTTDSAGAFVATILVPVGEPVSHDIVASDGTNSVTVTFTLTRGIVLSPTTGPVGTAVQIIGSGFLASNPITITFENVVVATTPASITSTVYGGFTASFNVTAVAPGARTVKALDNTGGSATATFTVIPSITLSVATGRGGTSVTVTGAGFVSSSTVLIKFNTTILLTTFTDSIGGFSQTITIPYVPRGVYVISANDTQGRTATATFTVTPLIAISPAAGSNGTYVTVTGSGFTGSTTVAIFFGGSQIITMPSTITTDSFGAFTAAFVVPLVASGSWNVRAQDSFGYQSTTTFSVGLNVVFSVARGIVGTIVTINGLGFAPSSRITFMFDSTVLATTPAIVTTDALGIFQASIVIPESIGQNHLIIVNDSAGNRVSTTFTLDESITISPVNGAIGTLVTVTGTGFRQANFVTITFDSSLVVTIPNPILTNSLGSFTASFTVPVVNPGARTVRAADNIGNAATATFTVTPSISLSAATGRGGTTTTITGTGFATFSTVTIKFDGTIMLTAPTDSTGWFRQAITVPLVAAGIHTIQVTDAGNQTATATFSVTPTFTLSRTSGPIGVVVTVTGVGFSAISNITMTFAGVTLSTTPSSVVTNTFGGFTCSFTVPEATAGVWTIRAIDALGNKIDTTFTITRRFVLSPASGVVGSSILASGIGFSPNAQVIITYDTFPLVTTPALVTTDANGTFNAAFIIPESIYGYHTITATDASGGYVSATFTTTTSIVINPSNGVAGTVINIAGTGFGDLTSVTVSFDTVPMVTTPALIRTNVFGSFSAMFTVLSNVSGAHTVRATDLLGYTATATFTNPRQISLSSRNGYNLAALTITGSGFDPISPISVTWDGDPLNVLPSPLTTNISGRFTAFFTVPLDVAGRHYVNATDLSGHTASDTYTISPYISVTPDGLSQDDPAWITGRGFSGSSAINITWDGIQPPTTPQVITTDTVGDFTGSFRIPVSTFGNHRVVAVDQNGNIVSVQYLVTTSTAGNSTLDLEGLNASLSSIDDQLALLSTLFGPIHTHLDTIQAEIASVQGSMVLVKSLVGSMNVSLSNLTPILIGINGSMVSFQTDLGLIEETFEDLHARSITMENELVVIETDVGSIVAALGNLTGVTIAVQTSEGTQPVTLFTDMDLSKVEYKNSDQAVLLACSKGPDSQGAISLVVSKETMRLLGSSPSQVELFDGNQEILFSVTELQSAYVLHTTSGQGQHQLVFYLKGMSSVFSNPWLLMVGFVLFILLVGGLFLSRMRRGKVRYHRNRTQTIQRIEQFIDEYL